MKDVKKEVVEKVVDEVVAPKTLKVPVHMNFVDVMGYARKAVNLIKEEGDTALALVEDGFNFFSAITGKDYPKIFDALSKGRGHAEEVINAIRQTFNL